MADKEKTKTHMIDKEKTGKMIAHLRKQKGWTQTQLAELLDVTNKAVTKWESGKGLPDIQFLPGLSEHLGVSIETILFPPTEPEESGQEKLVDGFAASLMNEKELQAEVNKFAPMCVRHKILLLDEVIKIKNRQVIQALIDKYPISYAEYFYFLLEKSDLRNIYQFAIDCGAERLACRVLQGDREKICTEIFKYNLQYTDKHRDIDINWGPNEGALTDLGELDSPTNIEALFAIQYGNIKYIKYHICGDYINEEDGMTELDFYRAKETHWLAKSLLELKNCRKRLMRVLKTMEEYNG